MSEWKLPAIQMPDPGGFRPILVVVNKSEVGDPILQTEVAYVLPISNYSRSRIIPARGYGAAYDSSNADTARDVERVVCWRELPDAYLVVAEMGVL